MTCVWISHMHADHHLGKIHTSTRQTSLQTLRSKYKATKSKTGIFPASYLDSSDYFKGLLRILSYHRRRSSGDFKA
eukprot:764055-Hanusia_phi.AAC.3